MWLVRTPTTAEKTPLRCRITKAEFTVVQKLNQGTNPQRGCNPLPGSFFGSFLEKQKRTRIKQIDIFFFNRY